MGLSGGSFTEQAYRNKEFLTRSEPAYYGYLGGCMYVAGIQLLNYRAHKTAGPATLAQLEVIVGRNDAGKSSLLYAMDAFFNGGTLKPENWSSGCGNEDQIEITLFFANLDSAKDKLTTMRLLSKKGELVVKKSFDKGSRKPIISLFIEDYVEEDFRNLYSKSEPALNRLGEKCNLDIQRSGRSITNDSKREKLSQFAERMSVRKDEAWVKPEDDALAFVENIMPTFRLFRSDIELETERADVQNPFQILVQGIMEGDPATDAIQQKIRVAVESEVKKIESNLTRQTGALTGLKPVTRFQWNKLVTLNFETEDEYGMKVPLEYRGLGFNAL